jgi:acyl-CoA synthetase (AMP-forming)/AMP-acid ligase II/nucleoside-diphosphate-sugar epimerase
MMLSTTEIEDIYPLSPMQRGMLFHTLYAPQSGVYFQQVGCTLHGDLDRAAFRRAWAYVMARHAVLRSAVVWEGLDEPMQVVLRQVPLPLEELDWRELPLDEQHVQRERFMQADQARGFDPLTAPLMRLALIQLADDAYQLIWSRHHLLLDGWSVSLILREVFRCYAMFRQGLPPGLEPPRPYRDYLAWLQRQDLARAEEFWRAALAGFQAATRLDIDRALGSPPGQEEYGEHALELPRATTAALQSLSRVHHLTLNTLVQGAWALLLNRYSHQTDIVFGATTSGRPSAMAGVELMAGVFINTLPVRVRLTPETEVLPWLLQLQSQQAKARQYDYSPLVEIQGWSAIPRGTPLFESIVVFENFPLAFASQELGGGLAIEDVRLFERANYPLTLLAIPGDQLALRITYATERFDAAAIARMSGHLQMVLAALAADPAQRLADISLLTEAERRALLPLVDTAIGQGDVCFPQVFEAQVARTLDNVALVFEGQRLTYRALNRRANQLAHYLRSLGVGPEVCVGLYLERSPELVVGVVGILKAGGACLLLDPADPAHERVRQLKAAHAAALVTQQTLDAGQSALEDEPASANQSSVRQPSSAIRAPVVVYLDAATLAHMPAENPASAAKADSLAFILHTTGSAVLIQHGALLARLNQLQRALGLSENDTLLHKAPLARFTAIWEICWPLLYGARLAIALSGGQDDPQYLQQVIADYAVSVVHFTPKVLAAFLDASQGTDRLGSLRAVLYSGATLALRERFFQHQGCELCQLYAPAEAIPQVIARQRPPIAGHGRVSDSSELRPVAYILDATLQPVPVGIFGEIMLPAGGLGRGYLHQPELTAQQFLADPFSATPGARMFRSGDQGRWLSDGSLELAPVAGRQAWIGDVRVDLRAVEAALLDDPAVEECAALIRELPEAGPALVAYIVANGTFAPERLYAHLAPRLPAALRPDVCIPLTRVPLTPDGRVDEQALAGIELIDTMLIRRWEEQLRAQAEIEQVVVVAQEATARPPALHLSELLPSENLRAVAPASLSATSPSGQAPGEEHAPTRMAISAGPPLTIPQEAPQTLAEALIRTATRHPHKGIIHIQSDGAALVQTYAQLLDQARRILGGLLAQGLQPRDQVILQCDRLNEHLPAFWACILGRITPVTVAVASSYDERNAVVNKLYNTWELLGHPPLLASERLIEPLAGLRTLLMPELRILSINELRAYPPAAPPSPAGPHEVAFCQLTSGSTGVPKCIQETHHGVICHIHASQQVNGYSTDDITLNWLPIDHVVPLLMYHIKDVYLGCQQIQVRPDMILADPLRWLDLIEQYGVTHTWAPNFGYKLLSDRLAKSAGKRWQLSSIRRFLNAGEQVTLPVVREFLQAVAPLGVAPLAMQPAYGMAELCTAMTYVCDFDPATSVGSFDKGSLHGQLRRAAAHDLTAVNFVEVGPPMPGVAIRIVGPDNQLRSEGVIGRLQVQGAVVTPGYLNNPIANQEAFTDDGWFYTGDLGFILDGRLTITGREKEVIIINGANYYCYEIEDIVNGVPGVEATYVAAVAIDDPRSGTEGIAIFFTPAVAAFGAQLELIKTIRSRMVASLGLSPLYVVPVPKNDFPKTTSGKIQRTQLRAGLMSGQFQETLKAIDVALENSNTLPDWFYRRAWRHNEATTALPLTDGGLMLVFLDALGLGAALCAKLYAAGHRCITVEASSDFAQLDDTRYRIAPGTAEHYRMLLAALREHVRVDRILHLWTYAVPAAEPPDAAAILRAQDAGVYSVLFLTQMLAQVHRQDERMRLDVISSGVQAVAPEDQVAYERTTILGLVKTIPQELPWLSCRHIDLPNEQVETNVARLLRELQSPQKEREVAYRDGRRLVARLERVDLRQEPMQELPFKTGGVYLLSGGLGGIASILARHLREHYDARLILVGRTPLPDQSPNPDHRKAWQELQQLGQICYEAVDICDSAALRDVVTHAEARWQRKLDGVLHLAGTYHERLLADETDDTFAEILRPKLLGTWALHQLLANRPEAFFIGFSSVNSFFGGFGAGAYAAANSFLEGFTRYRQRAGQQRSFCYAWSMWEGIGISRDFQMKELAHARGYAAISVRQGLLSLLAGLHHGQADLLIGLDRSRAPIRRLVETEEYRAQQLWGYFTSAGDPLPVEEIAQLAVYDRFQTRSRCAYMQLPSLPRTDDGRVDHQALPIPGGGRLTQETAYVAPQTDLERMIAGIWQETLRVEKVGIHDNFFDLGGQSLLMAQVQGKLRATLNRDISMVDMFRYPTISTLSKHLGAAQPAVAAPQGISDRKQKQRAAIYQQKQLAKSRRDRDE